MILQLKHSGLPIFNELKEFVIENYTITRKFPSEEKYGLVQQIRRAALSVHLNIAEGCSRSSANERKRFFEISRSSLIEVDTSIDRVNELHYSDDKQLELLSEKMLSLFKQLCALIKHS